MRWTYLINRLVFLVLVIWSASTVNFFLPRISGQDPIRSRMVQQMGQGVQLDKAGIEAMIQAYDHEFGLDKPLWQQYLNYLGDLMRLDLKQSISNYLLRVSDLINGALPWTIGLLGVTTVLSVLLGSLFGALVAWRRSAAWLQLLAAPLMALSSIPYYLLSLIMLFIFAWGLKWLPGHGGYSIIATPTWTMVFALDVLQHQILPALSIILSATGFWALGMRGNIVTVEGEDFMTLAEAKGLKASTLFFRCGLRNCLLPQTTSLALALGYVLSGSILVEVVFGLPGIGTILFEAILLFTGVGSLLVDAKQARPLSAPTFRPPSLKYPFGTDKFGRNLLAVMIAGTPLTLEVGLVAGVLGVGIATVLAFVAAYYGGWADTVIRWVVDVGLTIPNILILVMIAIVVRNISVNQMALVVSSTAWLWPTRTMRSQVLSIKERNYVELARLSGMGGLETSSKS